MNRFPVTRPEPTPPNESPVIDPVVFSQLYDQYASMLYGVIVAIVCDETAAARLLELTFEKIRTQFGQPRPKTESLFVWLFSIARNTALDATAGQTKTGQSSLQLTSTGNVMPGAFPGVRAGATVTNAPPPVPSSANELIQAVLFRNCTPEEAASSVGLPVATARQHLRLAMLQLRGQQPR